VTSPSGLPSRPEGVGPLRDPVLVVAFEGWNDAGDAASAAVAHLAEVWNAEPVAELDPDDYYDFQVNRPSIAADPDDENARVVSWPSTQVSVCSVPGSARDLVLVQGLEPNVRWRSFCAELLQIVDQLGVTLVIALGALLADSPHTRPVPVTGTSSDPALGARLGASPSRYEGPTGIVGVLTDAAKKAGLPVASFWAAVPHYVAQTSCPKATLALLRRVEDLLDVRVPLADLPEEAREWERRVDEIAAQDSEVAEYVAALEEREPETDLPEATGEAIAREFERYLQRGDDPPNR
jgi:proteasome assembly chaperone (PAC2) family protein